MKTFSKALRNASSKEGVEVRPPFSAHLVQPVHLTLHTRVTPMRSLELQAQVPNPTLQCTDRANRIPRLHHRHIRKLAQPRLPPGLRLCSWAPGAGVRRRHGAYTPPLLQLDASAVETHKVGIGYICAVRTGCRPIVDGGPELGTREELVERTLGGVIEP